MGALLFGFLWAISPVELQSDRIRESGLFDLFLQPQVKVTCDAIQAVREQAVVAYPNPYFLKRLDGLDALHSCRGMRLSPDDVPEVLGKLPHHLVSDGVEKWFCKNAQTQMWKWIDSVLSMNARATIPQCLSKPYRWLWNSLALYHKRDYVGFLKRVDSLSVHWVTIPDLNEWMQSRMILAAKRTGNRVAVLKLYRKWFDRIQTQPWHQERRDIELWLIRWEALVGEPRRLKPLLQQWKSYCRSRIYEDKQCSEFLHVWLSRYWYENRDRHLSWIPKNERNEHVIWWQAMRSVAQRQWEKAWAELSRLRFLTQSPVTRKRTNFWLNLVASQSSNRTDWQLFVDTYGEQDFYRRFAEGTLGRSVFTIPESSDRVPLSLRDSACRAELQDYWPKLKSRGGESIIRDDVQWLSDRLGSDLRRHCLRTNDQLREALTNHCSPHHSPWARGFLPFEEHFLSVSSKHQVPKNLLVGLSQQESAFCPQAVSWADAIGLMQLQWKERYRRSGQAQGPQDLFNPKVNVETGTLELKRLSKKFNRDWSYILAAYNAGEDVVSLWKSRRAHSSGLQFIELIPFGETRNYVQKIFNNWNQWAQHSPDPGDAALSEWMARLSP